MSVKTILRLSISPIRWAKIKKLENDVLTFLQFSLLWGEKSGGHGRCSPRPSLLF